jgi:hypothetical protein
MGASCIINTAVIICCVLTSRTRERFIEGQAFLQSYDSAPRPPPPSPPLSSESSTGVTQEDWERGNLLTGEGGRRWAWSRIIQPKESLALNKSFNILSLGQRECILYGRLRTRWKFVVQERSPKFQYIDLCVRQLMAVGGTMLGWVCNSVSVHHSYTVKTVFSLHKTSCPLHVLKGVETNCHFNFVYLCAADFSLLNLPKGKSLGRSKPATNN